MLSITKFGEKLSYLAQLEQSLSLYFRTPKGSICLHPELGFGILNYVDRNITAVLNLIREASTGIALWENRIVVTKIAPTYKVGELDLTVTWYPKDDPNSVNNTVITI